MWQHSIQLFLGVRVSDRQAKTVKCNFIGVGQEIIADGI